MIAAQALQHVLREGQRPTWLRDIHLDGIAGHALTRLITAIEAEASPLDRAVLVRQCLRRLPAEARVVVPTLASDDAIQFERAGIAQSMDGTLSATPYHPRWVAAVGGEAVDLPSREGSAPERPVPGEPWLRRLVGKSTWKSAAQREAVWHALGAPPNSTLLVGLPTGSGKSLVAQCCAAFESGLTVLVVPTVALGLDQLAAVAELPCAQDLMPLLYPGEEPEATLSAVERRHCRLLITSPEAIVSGRLRGVLSRHAADGFLVRLVVDEAHLVESWGADFRIEFQLLGSVLRDWVAASPSGVRTLLLSATFSPTAPNVLRAMFSASVTPWRQHVVQRLRPEIHYFTSTRWASADEQRDWITEALMNMPRPAILYVTERSQAEAWGAHVAALGFSRFRVFHGDTKASERSAVMKAWRADQLDLVVGTSAFGMGVDKPDVKTILHACFPEGIDRFYQEVGRGGRDGQACTSLLVPTRRDARVAKTMGPRLLKDPEKINGRWRAMWHSKVPGLEDSGGPSTAVRVRTDVQPEHSFGVQSYAENVRWNKRLLLMMERAGMLRLEALRREPGLVDEWVEWVTVRPLISTFDLLDDLAGRLTAFRDEEIVSTRRAVNSLIRHFDRQQAICRELRSHYGERTRRACGSCAFCRSGSEQRVAVVPLHLDEEAPWSVPRIQVVQAPALSDVQAYPVLVQAIRQLLQSGTCRRFVIPAAHRGTLSNVFEHAERGFDQHYRIDDLEEGVAATVGSEERVVVLHARDIDDRADELNRHGHSVAHWLLGANLEASPSGWPYMYEYGARPYLGIDGLAHWLHDQQRVQATRQALS